MSTTHINNVESQSHVALPFVNRQKFLIVEDDFTLQPFWEHVIQEVSPNALIRWATTEEGAEKLIRDRHRINDRFDVVITDILLAGEKTGVDLWKRYGSPETVFLFTSGLSVRRFNGLMGQDDSEEAILIRKPLNPIQCVESLKAVLAYHSFFPKNEA